MRTEPDDEGITPYIAHIVAHLHPGSPRNDEAVFLRHIARHLCEQADEIAAGYIPAGEAMPDEAERYAARSWLNP